MKTNTTLKYLDLSSNKIKKEGFIKIIEALQENQTLTTLGLAGHFLEDEDVYTLLEICKTRDIDFLIDFNFYLEKGYAAEKANQAKNSCIIS